MPSEERIARTVLAAICGYEFVALTTRRIPTVSAWVWKGCSRRHGRPVIAGVWALVVAWGTQHFFSTTR